MKLNKFFAIVFSILFFSSCQQDESLDPRPLIVDGQFVALDITKQRLQFENLETTEFGGLLTAPGNNVAKYDLYVRRRNPSGIITSDYKLLLTVESFPTALSITPSMIANALGITVADLEKGDNYHFRGYATGFDGTVTDYNSLSATVRGLRSYKQAFLFRTDLQENVEVFSQDYIDNYF
jgi:hypothetical protein